MSTRDKGALTSNLRLMRERIRVLTQDQVAQAGGAGHKADASIDAATFMYGCTSCQCPQGA